PALVPEADGGAALHGREVPVDLRADPFGGTGGHLPDDPLRGHLLQHLHVEEAPVAELEVDEAARLGLTTGVAVPPGRQRLAAREGVVDVARRRLDADAMQAVEHGVLPFAEFMVSTRVLVFGSIVDQADSFGRRAAGTSDGAHLAAHAAATVEEAGAVGLEAAHAGAG